MRTARGRFMYYADRLNETPWLTVLGYAWAAFATLAVLQLVTPAHWYASMRTLGLALPLLLLVAKDVAQLPDVLARLRTLRGRHSGVADWLAACLPPGLPGWMRLERALWRGFFGWLLRQPRPARPAGMRFTYDAQGAYSTFIALGLFSVFVELPLDAAIVPLLLRDPAAAQVVHLCVALGCAYTLVWLLGDRWLVRGGCHVLTDTRLDLRVGARASASIPLEAIENAQLLRQPLDAWRRANGVRPSQAVNITPFDKPNLVLRLRAGADCAIEHHGVVRTGVRYVSLYLDCPEQLVGVLDARYLDQE